MLATKEGSDRPNGFRGQIEHREPEGTGFQRGEIRREPFGREDHPPAVRRECRLEVSERIVCQALEGVGFDRVAVQVDETAGVAGHDDRPPVR
jgi:hypothetical protein